MIHVANKGSKVAQYGYPPLLTSPCFFLILKSKVDSYLKERPHAVRSRDAERRANQESCVFPLHALDSERSVGIDVHVAVGSVGKHEQLRAFFVPKDGRRRVPGGGALEFHHAVQTDFLVLRAFYECRWS